MTTTPLLAINRLGFGSRPADAIPSNATSWAMDQLHAFQPRPVGISATVSGAEMVRQLAEYREAKRQAKLAGDAAAFAEKKMGAFLREGYVAQASARIEAALASATPFAERLTAFWANHFAVSTDKQETIGLAGPLEFEAIRPNLTGKFVDLWLAVMRHPAMLLYLDQAQSIGPNSPLARSAAGRGKQLGLNENLAREAMELHSMGVRSGYSQADVTELARALTGWSVGGFGRNMPPRFQQPGGDQPGQFTFRDAMHEPGERIVLGRRYSAGGERQARAILVDLASRPETATHIATKLATHFVGDTPPGSLIARLTEAFQASGGDLPLVYRALIESPETFAAGTGKFKTPWDWTISSLRAFGVATADQKVVGALGELGQPVWKPGSPAGWADTAGAWAGPDALLRRIELAQRIANQVVANIDPRVLGPRLLGTLSTQTTRVLAAADSPARASRCCWLAPNSSGDNR